MPSGFFTAGVPPFHLPHPEVGRRTILLICRVLRKAWRLLAENPPEEFDVLTADEDAITEQLVGILENRLRKTGEVRGFDAAFFGRVEREPKITNYNKKHPDKMPDMFFDLKREELPTLSEQDGLFVECKPIDRTHPIGSCYCRQGVIRFVNGDYAWAMQEAMMIGYMREPHSYSELERAFAAPTMNLALCAKSADDKLLFSTHGRKFQWLQCRGVASPITIAHLWLEASPASS